MTGRRAKRDLAALQERIGHQFNDSGLLLRALTHASATNGTDRESGQPTYQRLEFLGDRVLGLIIADRLARGFPNASEGELSRRLARLVNKETCAEIGRQMDLKHHMIIDRHVLRRGKAADGLHADVCEAIIGALYRDGGLDVAREFVETEWGDRIVGDEDRLRDAKTELQEWAHRNGYDTPRYEVTSRSGPDHAPTFRIEVVIPDVDGATGSGGSKREAEHDAAEQVLRREGIWTG